MFQYFSTSEELASATDAEVSKGLDLRSRLNATRIEKEKLHELLHAKHNETDDLQKKLHLCLFPPTEQCTDEGKHCQYCKKADGAPQHAPEIHRIMTGLKDLKNQRDDADRENAALRGELYNNKQQALIIDKAIAIGREDEVKKQKILALEKELAAVKLALQAETPATEHDASLDSAADLALKKVVTLDDIFRWFVRKNMGRAMKLETDASFAEGRRIYKSAFRRGLKAIGGVAKLRCFR